MATGFLPGLQKNVSFSEERSVEKTPACLTKHVEEEACSHCGRTCRKRRESVVRDATKRRHKRKFARCFCRNCHAFTSPPPRSSTTQHYRLNRRHLSPKNSSNHRPPPMPLPLLRFFGKFDAWKVRLRFSRRPRTKFLPENSRAPPRRQHAFTLIHACNEKIA